MALTAPEGYAWIQATLKADAVLQASALGSDPRVYQDYAPEGIPTYPFVLIRNVTAIPLMALGAIDVYSNCLFDVFVVNRDNSRTSMKPIANRLDVVLNRASGMTADGEVFFCSKAPLKEIAFPDPPSPGGGARIQNLGRTWTLEIKAG